MSVESCENKGVAKLDPDSIFEEIGGFGKFQLRIHVLLSLPVIFIACSKFSYIFIARDLEYRCLIPECDVSPQNNSVEWIERAIPFVDGKLSKCERFATVSLNESDESTCPWIFNQSHVIKCKSFVFSTHERSLQNEENVNTFSLSYKMFKHFCMDCENSLRIRSECVHYFLKGINPVVYFQFNLTCDNNRWKLTIVGSLGYLGACMALPFVGFIGDKYGRRLTLICSITLASVIGITKTFATNYFVYLVLHFIGAVCGGGGFSLVFVYGSEAVGPNSRGLSAAILTNIFSASQILLAVVTKYISNFRIMLRVLYGLIALSLSFVLLVPESVRWLWSVGRHKEGIEILEKVAKLNGTELSNETSNSLAKHYKNELLLEDAVEDCKEAEGKIRGNAMLAALKSNILMGRLINCCYCYFANALIYCGLSIYSSSLPGDMHMNLLGAGIAEVCGNAATYFVLKRNGRKWSIISAMLICSIACIGSELILNPFLKITLFLIGKFAVSLTFTILNLYSTELFPTNVRQSMINTCMTVGECGKMLAPQLPLMSYYVPSFPLILFAGTSFSSALLVLLLPETRNKSMPDTIEEAIAM